MSQCLVWLALRSSPLSFCCPRTDLLSFLWHFVTGLSLPWTLGSRLLLVPVVNNFRISLTSFVVCSLSNVKSYKEKPFIKKQSVSNDAVQPTLTITCRSLKITRFHFTTLLKSPISVDVVYAFTNTFAAS